MNQKDIKLLWGRAANRCSMPDCRLELSQDPKAGHASFTLGEQAHIVGEKENAARGKSLLTEEERNSYHNLVLLCPNHHTEIDKNELDWPVEKLYFIKSLHEQWVRETLGNASDVRLLAKQLAVTSIIDAAVKLCQLENWREWTRCALSPDPWWYMELLDMIFEFRQRVVTTIWPEEYPELRRATITLAILLHNAANTFSTHAVIGKNGILASYKFYRNSIGTIRYDDELAQYHKWLNECRQLIKESTCAANWFADVVRRDINPMFFVERGKFSIVEGPFIDLSYSAEVLEFTEEQKNHLPESL